MENDMPTQDTAWADSLSQHSEVSGGARVWGRVVSTNSNYPSADLIDNEVIFGRKTGCQVHLKHAAISGQHCSLKRESPDVVWLTDLSTNGTWLNGAKVGRGSRVLLSAGNEIVLIRTATEKISYRFWPIEHERKLPEDGPESMYDIRRDLGVGAFAQVKECVNRQTGEKFAMKIIEKKKFALNHASKRPNALMDEVRILQRLNHPHIIKIYDVFDTESHLYLVLELVYGGDLFDRIISLGGRGFPEPRARVIFTQICEATQYLHNHNIVHRDLKPENILLSSKTSDDVKLSDFGLSRIVGEGSFLTTLCGTPQYLAPEVLAEGPQKQGYDKAVDIWSIGVILYILLSGTAPFSTKDGENNEAMLQQVKKGSYSFPARAWKSVSETGKHLVKRLMCADPEHRITIEQAAQHPWVKGLTRLPPARSPNHHTVPPVPLATSTSPSSTTTAATTTTTTTSTTTPSTPVIATHTLENGHAHGHGQGGDGAITVRLTEAEPSPSPSPTTHRQQQQQQHQHQRSITPAAHPKSGSGSGSGDIVMEPSATPPGGGGGGRLAPATATATTNAYMHTASPASSTNVHPSRKRKAPHPPGSPEPASPSAPAPALGAGPGPISLDLDPSADMSVSSTVSSHDHDRRGGVPIPMDEGTMSSLHAPHAQAMSLTDSDSHSHTASVSAGASASPVRRHPTAAKRGRLAAQHPQPQPHPTNNNHQTHHPDTDTHEVHLHPNQPVGPASRTRTRSRGNGTSTSDGDSEMRPSDSVSPSCPSPSASASVVPVPPLARRKSQRHR